MPNLAYKQPALQRNKPMDYAKPAGKGKGSSMKKKKPAASGKGIRRPRPKASSAKKQQGYNARLDESLGMRRGKASSKKQLKASRDESYGKWGHGTGKGKINKRKA